MRHFSLTALLLCVFTFLAFTQNTVVTDDAAYTGSTSAMLDVKSTSKGLLVPRVSLTSTTDQTTIGGVGAEPDGLLIYDEGTSIPEGFYFWDSANAVWVAYVAGINGGSIFIGQSSGANDDDIAQNNTAIGYESAKFNETGTSNTALGYQSGLGVTGNSFSNNTLIGYQSGLALTTGSNNALLGYQSGLSLTTGASNVFLGHLAGSAEAAGTSNRLFIDNTASSTPLVYGEFDNNLLQINGALAVANGATSAGSLSFYEDSDDGTNKISLISPALVADYTLTLPVDDGTSGQVLSTNGTGTLSWIAPSATTTGDFVFPRASGYGIKVDNTTPTFPWRDLIGEIIIRTTGSQEPVWSSISGTDMWAYKFQENDECWVSYHIPHDYVPGTDLYFHAHWMPDGTSTNNVKWQFEYMYAQGHEQAAFNVATPLSVYAEATPSGTIYEHIVSETAAVTIGTCEPDGIVYLHLLRVDDASNNPDGVFVMKADIHYQSTGIGTKNKAPSFY